MAKPIDIEKILPIYKVENNVIVSVFGDITVAYEVSLPEIFSLSNNEYESFHQTWVKAIRSLPKHSCFHKQDWFIKDTYEPDFESGTNSAFPQSFLSSSSERFFNERPFLNHKCYVFLSKKPEGRRPASTAFSSLF